MSRNLRVVSPEDRTDPTIVPLDVVPKESSKLLQSALDQWNSIGELSEAAGAFFDENMECVTDDVRRRARHSLDLVKQKKFSRSGFEDSDEITAATRIRDLLSGMTDGEE